MTIIPGGADRPRLDTATPARGPRLVTRVSEEPGSGPSAAPRSPSRDVLELSPAARALVARGGDDTPLPAERLIQLRQRVIDGVYDSPAMIDALAHAVRRSGDLR